MIASHERLLEREEQIDCFLHHIEQLRYEANNAVDHLYHMDLDYGYEQGVLNTLRQLETLFEQTFNKGEY